MNKSSLKRLAGEMAIVISVAIAVALMFAGCVYFYNELTV